MTVIRKCYKKIEWLPNKRLEAREYNALGSETEYLAQGNFIVATASRYINIKCNCEVTASSVEKLYLSLPLSQPSRSSTSPSLQILFTVDSLLVCYTSGNCRSYIPSCISMKNVIRSFFAYVFAKDCPRVITCYVPSFFIQMYVHVRG